MLQWQQKGSTYQDPPTGLKLEGTWAFKRPQLVTLQDSISKTHICYVYTLYTCVHGSSNCATCIPYTFEPNQPSLVSHVAELEAPAIPLGLPLSGPPRHTIGICLELQQLFHHIQMSGTIPRLTGFRCHEKTCSTCFVSEQSSQVQGRQCCSTMLNS